MADEQVQVAEASAERDYDAEARERGWKPQEEFGGSPERWTDAKTFVERADREMPLLKADRDRAWRENKTLKANIKNLIKGQKALADQAYARAVDELERKHAAAVDVGDTKAATDAAKAMRELEKPNVADETPAVDPAERKREFAEWADRNEWYDTDPMMRAYADRQADIMGSPDDWDGGNAEWLEEVARRTAKRFPNGSQAERKPNNANPSGNRPGPKGNGGKTYADMPPEARLMCDRMIRDKSLKMTRESYAKDYFGHE